MSDRPPTLYLTNAASRTPPHRGPGRVWTIMARPRPQYGEAGDGVCGHLVPNGQHLLAHKAGTMDLATYRRHFLTQLRLVRAALVPGELMAISVHRGRRGRRFVAHALQDGDTLICACSRAKAAQGECHRVWAAEVLATRGWRIVLDGTPLEDHDGT